ncbi:hypothetical protein BH18THE2_BH18THE2_00530 [soil metagenome]
MSDLLHCFCSRPCGFRTHYNCFARICNLYDLPFNPIISPHTGFWISTFSALLSALVKRIMTTSSASYMRLLSSEFPHRSSAFRHRDPSILSGWRGNYNDIVSPNYYHPKVICITAIEYFNRVFE